MTSSLTDRLAAYLGELWSAPTTVEGLSRIPGGASRETYRFDAVVRGERKPLILRRDPPGSLIDTDRRLEFLAFRSFHGTGVPVPEAVALEAEGGVLERPFFIMGRVDGGAAASPFQPAPYGEHAEALGEQVFAALGRIAAAEPAGLPLAEAAETPAPEDCARRELDYWAGVIEADELHPQPIARAAIRRLRRRLPPRAQRVTVVHGDFRSGNFLHDGAGRLLAVLDWEMAHLGDPLEDLAWMLDPLWAHDDPGRPGGLLPRAEALRVWERESGLRVDEAALRWWAMFAALKGLAIWISSAKAYRDGGGVDPVLGFSGWYTARRHDVILADLLAEEGP